MTEFESVQPTKQAAAVAMAPFKKKNQPKIKE
jgi:hypothetical protein